MSTTTRSAPTPQPVSTTEGFALLDEQAQTRLGISGQEFLGRWDAGGYNGPEGDRPEILKVAMLIPLAR